MPPPPYRPRSSRRDLSACLVVVLAVCGRRWRPEWSRDVRVAAGQVYGKPDPRISSDPHDLCINSLFATFADRHVRKRATFADLHSYTHAYGSFILLSEAITIVFWFALSVCVMDFPFWNFPYNL